MHPALSRQAVAALRTATIELDPQTSPATVEELLELGIVVEAPPADGRRRFVFTTLGARWALQIHIEEDEAVPCRCGSPYGRHDAQSPHACFDCGCRSFCSAKPVYTRPLRSADGTPCIADPKDPRKLIPVAARRGAA